MDEFDYIHNTNFLLSLFLPLIVYHNLRHTAYSFAFFLFPSLPIFLFFCRIISKRAPYAHGYALCLFRFFPRRFLFRPSPRDADVVGRAVHPGPADTPHRTRPVHKAVLHRRDHSRPYAAQKSMFHPSLSDHALSDYGQAAVRPPESHVTRTAPHSPG